MARPVTPFISLAVRGAIGLSVAGCVAPHGPRVVSNPDPSDKIPAIRQSVRKKDLKACKPLIADLESDDPAVRFYAINGLRRLTGQTFGYRYYDDEETRQVAADRWKSWLAEQEKKHK